MVPVYTKPTSSDNIWALGKQTNKQTNKQTPKQTNKQTNKQIITSFYTDSLATFSILIGFIIRSKHCLRIKYASILQEKKLFILLCLLIYFPGF